MYKFIFQILLLLFSGNLVCQSWFSDSHNWVYRYSVPFATSGFCDMYVLGDSLIDGQNFKILHKECVGINQSTGDSVFQNQHFYVFEKNQKVYFLNSSNQVDLLFDFNLEVGDSFYVGIPDYEFCVDSIEYTLDSISYLEIGGVDLEVQHFSFYDLFWEYNGERMFVEYAGSLEGGFFPYLIHQCATDLPGSSLCEFRIEGDFVNVLDTDCYELPVNTNDNVFTGFECFPNPIIDFLNISSSNEIVNCSLIEFSGKISLLEFSNGIIDLSNFNSGVYVLKVTDKNGQTYFKKLVKK